VECRLLSYFLLAFLITIWTDKPNRQRRHDTRPNDNQHHWLNCETQKTISTFKRFAIGLHVVILNVIEYSVVVLNVIVLSSCKVALG